MKLETGVDVFPPKSAYGGSDAISFMTHAIIGDVNCDAETYDDGDDVACRSGDPPATVAAISHGRWPYIWLKGEVRLMGTGETCCMPGYMSGELPFLAEGAEGVRERSVSLLMLKSLG